MPRSHRTSPELPLARPLDPSAVLAATGARAFHRVISVSRGGWKVTFPRFLCVSFVSISPIGGGGVHALPPDRGDGHERYVEEPGGRHLLPPRSSTRTPYPRRLRACSTRPSLPRSCSTTARPESSRPTTSARWNGSMWRRCAASLGCGRQSARIRGSTPSPLVCGERRA